jgi:ribosomal protein L22
MQAFQAEATPLPHIGAAAIKNCRATSNQDATAILHGIVARLAAVFDRRVNVERAIADKYACHAWCDSSERELNANLIGARNNFGR